MAAFYVLLFAAAPLIVAFFYFLTLHRTLNAVSPENRRIAPPMVWLAAIPGFNLIWCFFNSIEIPGSVRSEFVCRGLHDGTTYGLGLGIANAVLNFVEHLLLIAFCFWPPGRPEWEGQMLSLAIGGSLVASIVVFFKFWIRMAYYGEVLRTQDQGDDALWPQRATFDLKDPPPQDAIRSDDRRHG